MRPCVGLRFLKYSPGEYFKPHMDGVYATPDASMENGGFKVGDTKVLSNKDDMINIGVALRPGRILVFQHDILHEGSELKKGTKYTTRTDKIK